MKITVILPLLFLLSCQDETLSRPSFFQIEDNLKLYPPEEFIDGSLWEIEVYYYSGNTIVKTDNIEPILTGTFSPEIEVPENCDKIKFSFQIAPKKSKYYDGVANCRKYSKVYFQMKPNMVAVITIEDLESFSAFK